MWLEKLWLNLRIDLSCFFSALAPQRDELITRLLSLEFVKVLGRKRRKVRKKIWEKRYRDGWRL